MTKPQKVPAHVMAEARKEFARAGGKALSKLMTDDEKRESARRAGLASQAARRKRKAEVS